MSPKVTAIMGLGAGSGKNPGGRPEDISLGDVLRKAERGIALVECMKRQGNRCAITGACRLAGVLDSAQERFYQALEETTLERIKIEGTQFLGPFNLVNPLSFRTGRAKTPG